MARKPPRRPAARRASRSTPAGDADKSDRDRIVDAFMALLAEKRDRGDRLRRDRRRAPAFRSPSCATQFGSTLAILAAHMKEIDRAVLAGGDADMAEEPPRERLFDVLMRRLEALAPHKAAVRSLMRSAAPQSRPRASRSTGWRCARSNGC